MEREILIPLDGSAFAEAVLPYAVALARTSESSLRLFCCVAPGMGLQHALEPLSATISATRGASTRATAQIYLDDVASRLYSIGGVRCEVVTSDDAALSIMARAAGDPAITLIAMATHGRHGLGRWLFGSIANTVRESVLKPMLLIRSRWDVASEQLPTYTTILVPLDGSMFAEQALLEAKAIAIATSGSIVLVSVVPSLGESAREATNVGAVWAMADSRAEMQRVEMYLQQCTQQLQSEGLQVRSRTIIGMPAKGILQVADEEHADLVVMTTHGRGGWQRLRLGGVATRVIQDAKTPLLVIRGWEHQSRQPMITISSRLTET